MNELSHDEAFEAQLSQWLGDFESQLRTVVVDDNPFVSEAATHLIDAGGKRFRPALLWTCAQFAPQVDQQRLIDAALVIELTHVASLYHDDVMDEAELRRAAPSANARYGNTIAILVGDYLFARASRVVADLGSAFGALQAETFVELVRGQIAETKGPQPGDDAVAHHLSVIDGKTASLIKAAALFGAMVAGLDDEITGVLGEFGHAIGMLFQMSDDLIDITSDQTGKTPGTDLREGIPTLATLLLAASTEPADQQLAARLAGDLSDDAELAEVLAELRANHVIDDVKAAIASRSDAARALLAPLPEGAAKQTLYQLCDEVARRIS